MKILVSAADKGDFINHKGEIYQIVKIEHNFRGRGSANFKMKLKNVLLGTTVEETFKPDNDMDKLTVDTVQMQYLYKDAQNLTLMDERTYDQYELPLKVVGGLADYLKEGQAIYILMYDGKPLTLRPPLTVRLEVTEAQDAVKGNTATAAKKDVIVETGARVMVPLFIKKGDVIVVNPETGEYLERTNEPKE